MTSNGSLKNYGSKKKPMLQSFSSSVIASYGDLQPPPCHHQSPPYELCQTVLNGSNNTAIIDYQQLVLRRQLYTSSTFTVNWLAVVKFRICLLDDCTLLGVLTMVYLVAF